MKNKCKKAAALAYGWDENIPKVVASGKDKIALSIINKAKELNIPIFQNKELVDSLIKLDINNDINKETYLAVAKILSWLNKNEERYKLSNSLK